MVARTAVITYADNRGRPQKNGRTGLPPSGRYGLGGLDDARARTLLEKVSRSRLREDVSSHLAPGRCVWMAYDINNINKKWVGLRLRSIDPKYSQYGDICIILAGKNHRFLVVEPAFHSGRSF